MWLIVASSILITQLFTLYYNNTYINNPISTPIQAILCTLIDQILQRKWNGISVILSFITYYFAILLYNALFYPVLMNLNLPALGYVSALKYAVGITIILSTLLSTLVYLALYCLYK